jgi:hypothetical protein
MGYTCGRKLTDEVLRNIALSYKSRSEFQTFDPSAYRTARLKGTLYLDSICSHMVSTAFSIPQLMCKYIMETVLEEDCLYNTRKIIPPYELDIYFPSFKLAIEYCGKRWHSMEDARKRDKIKIDRCLENNIILIVIKENSRNYEEDVKAQIIENLDIINKITNKKLVPENIQKIECSVVYQQIYNVPDQNDIRDKILNCKNIKDFAQRNLNLYKILQKTNKLDILDEIRIIKSRSDDELIELCSHIHSYSEFINKHRKLYSMCYKRKLLKTATAHMTKVRWDKTTYQNIDNEMLLNSTQGLIQNFMICYKTELYNIDRKLYVELKFRNLLSSVKYFCKDDRIKFRLIEKAATYDTYDAVMEDVDFFKKCKSYKIINKVKALFPSPPIEEIIKQESKKYSSFSEFMKTEWYLKTKRIKGLIGEIKKMNGWKYYGNK